MELERQINQVERTAKITARGAFDLDSSLQSIFGLAKDPAFESSFGVLIDMREMHYELPVLDELEGIWDGLALSKQNYRGRMAVLCFPGPMLDLARLVCVRASLAGIQMEAFIDLHAAQSWIEGEALDSGNA